MLCWCLSRDLVCVDASRSTAIGNLTNMFKSEYAQRIAACDGLVVSSLCLPLADGIGTAMCFYEDKTLTVVLDRCPVKSVRTSISARRTCYIFFVVLN
jgi:hypothetical protein